MYNVIYNIIINNTTPKINNMPKHKPILFKTTLEPNLKKYITKIIKENPKSKSIRNTTLGIIALGGTLTFGPIIPTVLGGIAKIRLMQQRESYEEYRKIWRSFQNLRQQQALKFVQEKDGCMVYKLTKKGEKKVKKLIFDELVVPKPKAWDKKWRLVIFDIPESRRKERVAFRKKLKEIGFYQCKKSVWIHPFPCLEEIEFLIAKLYIKPFVKLFTVDEMTDGKALYHFRNMIKKQL